MELCGELGLEETMGLSEECGMNSFASSFFSF